MIVENVRSKGFQDYIIFWFEKGNRNLFWRKQSLNPWQWLVLELLLKKTRAETVNTLYPVFIKKYHNPKVVVEVSDQELEEDLKPLGLQRQRRVALKGIAKKIILEYNGKVPLDYDSLKSLSYIGRYAANAILCFSRNERRSIVDINVARVLTRFFGLEMPKDAREEWIWELAEKLLPLKKWKEYNYGLLDLGALVCKSRYPKCISCVLHDNCVYNGTKTN